MKNLKLSRWFSLGELCVTNTGLPNFPDNYEDFSDVYWRLKGLVRHVLDRIRRKYGAVVVNSGYRSLAVNNAIAGSPTSQHCGGFAADIRVPGVDTLEVWEWCRQNLPVVDQCIFEKRGKVEWIHISKVPSVKLNRMQFFKIVK